MERHIKLYVKNKLFRGLEKPSQFNRRYNPTNHMYQATVRLRFSNIDQNNLAHAKLKNGRRNILKTSTSSGVTARLLMKNLLMTAKMK